MHRSLPHVIAPWLTACACCVSATTRVVPVEYRSIQAAVDDARGGDTVLLLNGTYHESVILKERVCLMGQDAAKTVVRGTRKKPVIRAANDAIIRKITLENGSAGVLCENARARIQECVIRTNKTGIHCLVSLPTIRNNAICRNTWTGIYCDIAGAGPDAVIEHNIVADNGACGVVVSGTGAALIQNNIFLGNGQYAVHIDRRAARCRIVYNNFYRNRKPFNTDAAVDRTNCAIDPGHPSAAGGVFDYFLNDGAPMKGLGKDGADIGPVTEEWYRRFHSDIDKDGIRGDSDKCPDMAEDYDSFEDEDGCPDFDNDRDGIYDAKDQCPQKAEDADLFEDNDGCPDLDNDRDGILDGDDRCPNTPETVNGFSDRDGCPDTPPSRQ